MATINTNPGRYVRREYNDDNGHPSVSSVVVVSRKQWELIGGFDEQFKGWGFEDTAFAAAAATFGGIVRMEGEVIHFWHPTQREGKRGTPSWPVNSARGQAVPRSHRQSRRNPKAPGFGQAGAVSRCRPHSPHPPPRRPGAAEHHG